MADWIIPCNPQYYDVFSAFSELSYIDWRQSAKNIMVGDYVYIYISSPVKEIRYKCIVEKTALPFVEIDDAKYIRQPSKLNNSDRYMRLRCIKQYPEKLLSFCVLKEHDLRGSIQGPRRAPAPISKLLYSLD